ncbi:LysR family transcriptional regulator [Oceanobacter mangrovi]|uniref:LysR family transcriptional regulator n=1 Tax=Oceanobacter mangrovi TaxID=2862510 RepID=UPI001C8F1860|nr:LysR family transcriptional regulator [Oceanobacter mangrovi]
MSASIEKLKIFCVCAESTSFREAAIKLNTSPQSVTRAIRDLETSFSEILFVRSTRNIRITQFGEHIYQKAKPAISEISSLLEGVSDQDIPIRIAAPSLICSHFIMPMLPRLHQQDSRLRFEFQLSDTVSDVVDDRIDIGIRLGPQIRDGRFIARSIGKLRFSIVATPALIERCGKPEHLIELDQFPIVALQDTHSARLWPWRFAHNHSYTPASPLVVCNDAEAELQAVLNGMGFGRIPSCLADPLIADGKLVAVLEDFAADRPWDVFIYRPQRGPVSRRVRLVYDFMIEELRMRWS